MNEKKLCSVVNDLAGTQVDVAGAFDHDREGFERRLKWLAMRVAGQS